MKGESVQKRLIRSMEQAVIHEQGSADEPTLVQCLEKERALLAVPLSQGAEARAAMAATDEAVKAMQERIAELEGLFDRMWEADMRGIKLWREEDPEARDLIWPDRAALMKWLLEKFASHDAKKSEGQPKTPPDVLPGNAWHGGGPVEE